MYAAQAAAAIIARRAGPASGKARFGLALSSVAMFCSNANRGVATAIGVDEARGVQALACLRLGHGQEEQQGCRDEKLLVHC